jgi:hypothetical protein
VPSWLLSMFLYSVSRYNPASLLGNPFSSWRSAKMYDTSMRSRVPLPLTSYTEKMCRSSGGSFTALVRFVFGSITGPAVSTCVLPPPRVGCSSIPT